MIDATFGGADRRKPLSSSPARTSDEDLIEVCQQFVQKIREFYSPTSTYFLAEAAGIKGRALDEAASAQIALYDKIEALQARLVSLSAVSQEGLSAKIQAFSALRDCQGSLAATPADEINQSCLVDLRALNGANMIGKTSSLDWVGRRHSDHFPAIDPSEPS